MTRQQLALLMNGDADPLLVISAASTSELQALTDALFRDLDTSHPVFGAQVWYDLALEELENRNNGASPQANGLTGTDSVGAA
ncbi:hypothetical protein TV39_01430 [Arthrobacter sp. SPG23]|uniref:hypothetical protein n=1 Tax=Arthrobacter sp. SPG23 TaxID=1610703 RepID=UPI0005BE07FD|nr:hypothetical protein [Arthrobacter sp. SPG23]KIS29074.1 hypothetical protein TV39_01430 [Arthrobacter sp. SPG23]